MPRGRNYPARTVPQGRGARLRKTWCRFAMGDAVALSTTQIELMSCTIAEQGALDTTVLRTRGNLVIVGAPNAVTDSEVVGLGVCVVSATALGIGGTSLPGPIADIGSDMWLWHRFVPLEAGVLTAGLTQSITVNERVEIDSRAMRRLMTDQAVVLVGELSIGSFGSVQVLGGIAFLIGS